jgi:ribosomal protein L28
VRGTKIQLAEWSTISPAACRSIGGAREASATPITTLSKALTKLETDPGNRVKTNTFFGRFEIRSERMQRTRRGFVPNTHNMRNAIIIQVGAATLSVDPSTTLRLYEMDDTKATTRGKGYDAKGEELIIGAPLLSGIKDIVLMNAEQISLSCPSEMVSAEPCETVK